MSCLLPEASCGHEGTLRLIVDGLVVVGATCRLVNQQLGTGLPAHVNVHLHLRGVCKHNKQQAQQVTVSEHAAATKLECVDIQLQALLAVQPSSHTQLQPTLIYAYEDLPET